MLCLTKPGPWGHGAPRLGPVLPRNTVGSGPMRGNTVRCSNKKLVVTGATLVVTGALLVVTRS